MPLWSSFLSHGGVPLSLIVLCGEWPSQSRTIFLNHLTGFFFLPRASFFPPTDPSSVSRRLGISVLYGPTASVWWYLYPSRVYSNPKWMPCVLSCPIPHPWIIFPVLPGYNFPRVPHPFSQMAFPCSARLFGKTPQVFVEGPGTF